MAARCEEMKGVTQLIITVYTTISTWKGNKQ